MRHLCQPMYTRIRAPGSRYCMRSGFQTRQRSFNRALYRRLIALPLLFFLVSGLAWTNIWGGKIVQPWGSLPGTTYKARQAVETEQKTERPPVTDHASMNEAGLHRVPWAVEQ